MPRTFYEEQPNWLHNRKGGAMAKLINQDQAMKKAMEAVAKLNVEIEKLRENRNGIIENCCQVCEMTYTDFDIAYRSFLREKGESEK